MESPEYYVGIDISSADFTVCAGTMPWQIMTKAAEFENNQAGFELLLNWLEHYEIQPDNAILCMEATGVYGEKLAEFINTHQYQLAVEPPLKVKRAFKTKGHKNDRVDSQQIAEYSYRFYDELVLWQPRTQILEQIKVLLASREQLVVQKTAHKNILHALKRKVVATLLAEQIHQQSILQIEQYIKQIEKEIKRLVAQEPHYQQIVKLLISIPGVGLLLATQMLLIIENSPDQSLNPKQLAAYIGICPYEHTSGSSVHRPATSRRYGPPAVRKLLYLASLSVRTHNPIYKKYFLRKVAEGKPKKVALNNISNKLLKVMCAVIKSQTPFIKNYRSIHPDLLLNA